ncbi:MAG: NAD(P)-dependent oxidoreductase [Sulfuricella sp.]
MSGPVLILGHSGFIGGAIAEHLQRHHPGISVLKPPRLDLTGRKAAAELAPWIAPDSTVILCAAVKKQYGDTLDTYSANQRISENLCRLIAAHPPARIVYFSSAAVYGEENSNLAISEDTPVNPSTWYGLGKQVSEKMLEKTVRNTSASLAILRPPLIYGSGDTSRGYGPTGFAWSAAQDRGNITLWGEGEELREFVYIEDAARVAVEIALSNFTGVLNLASGTSHSYREALDALAGLAPLSINSRPRSKSKIDQGYDNTRMRRLLPHIAFTTLDQAIARTFAEFFRAAA